MGVEEQDSAGHGEAVGSMKPRQIKCSASEGAHFHNATCHSVWRVPLSLFWKIPRDFITYLIKQPLTFGGRRISLEEYFAFFFFFFLPVVEVDVIRRSAQMVRVGCCHLSSR